MAALLVLGGLGHHVRQNPVGDNATEEGRTQNRRIALLVTQK